MQRIFKKLLSLIFVLCFVSTNATVFAEITDATEIAESEIDFSAVDVNSVQLSEKQETNFGDLYADAFYYYVNEIAKTAKIDCDAAFVTGADIKQDLSSGIINYGKVKEISSDDKLCVAKLTGLNILDALEWGSQNASEKSFDGFLQVAGLSCKIDNNIKSTVQKDDKNSWKASPLCDYRVYDVKIYNKKSQEYEDLNLQKTYTVVSSEKLLKSCDYGFNMFKNADIVAIDDVKACDALAEYLKAFKDSDKDGRPNISNKNIPLKAYKNYLLDYEDAKGSERIIYEKMSLRNVITAEDKTLEYSTKEQTFKINAEQSGDAFLTYSSDNKNVKVNKYGVVTIDAKFIGSAVIAISASETSRYPAAVKTITVTVNKLAQSMKLSCNKKSFSYKKLQKSSKTFKIKAKNTKGKVSYKSSSKYITVSKKGKVKIKKGIKKGSYEVTVTARGNSKYARATQTVTITIE